MLRFDHLHTGYGSTCISRNLCGQLERGTLTALLGTNGSGKSTLLRTLAGLQPALTLPDEASPIVRLDRKTWADYTPRELARTLSIVLTYRPEVENLTADDVVCMGRIPYSTPFNKASAHDRQCIAQAFAMTETTDFRHRRLSTLSDGERQRVFIAKALAQDTPLILLDEPTAFLDFSSKIGMMQLLARLTREQHKTILLSTHDIEPVLHLADRLWLLGAEGIVSGTPDALGTTGDIERFFCREGIHYDVAHRRFSYSI